MLGSWGVLGFGLRVLGKCWGLTKFWVLGDGF